jgi:hypothetical protein
MVTQQILILLFKVRILAGQRVLSITGDFDVVGTQVR